MAAGASGRRPQALGNKVGAARGVPASVQRGHQRGHIAQGYTAYPRNDLPVVS